MEVAMLHSHLDALETLTTDRQNPLHVAQGIVDISRRLLGFTAGVESGDRLALARIVKAHASDPSYREPCQILAIAVLLKDRATMAHDDDNWQERWYRDARVLLDSIRKLLGKLSRSMDEAAYQDSDFVPFSGAASYMPQ